MAIIVMSMAMLTSCFTPRKAELRRCGKADRLLAKAAMLCPDALQRDSATLHLRGDSAALPVAYAMLDSAAVDSLLAACAELHQALMQDAAPARPLDAAPLAMPPDPAPPARTPSVQQAVQRVQQAVCRWESTTDTVNGWVITVHNGELRPLITVEQLPRTVKAPCPPVVTRPPCPTLLDQLMDASLWLLAWALVALAALYLFLRFVKPLLPRR